MRIRSLVLSLFLVVAVLFLGLGYARLTNTLNVGGTIGSTPDNSNLDVRFANDTTAPAATKVSSDNVTVGGFSYESKSVTFGVAGFTAQNQSATIILKVVNNSVQHEDYAAYLSKEFGITMTHGEGRVTATGSQTGNIYTGEHFRIAVSYIESYENRLGETVNATGTITEGQPRLDAVGNEYVFVKIEISVINPIVGAMDEHQFTISFDAYTVAE